MIALAVLSLTAPTALAEPPDEPRDAHELFYAEGATYFSVGYSYLKEEAARTIGQTGTDKGFHRIQGGVKDAEGITAVFGKRAFETLAIEFQFEYAEGFDFTDSDNNRFKTDLYTTTLNARVYALHSLLRDVNEGRIQPYLLGGVGMMVTRDLDIDTGASLAIRAGAGVDYFFRPKWSIHMKSSYVHPFGQLKGLRFVTTSLGLTYQLD